MFGEGVGKSCPTSGEGGRRKGVSLLLSMWLLRCIVEWKEVSSRLISVRMRLERERYVFI